MQPLEAQPGVSTKSQLFNSLRVYLNNKNRLQPIIGLDSITECVKASTHHDELLYLCEVCVCRLSKADMRNHIMGSLHRYNYIKARHPHLVSEWEEKSDLSKLAWPLMDMARVLEGEEGPGQVQWLEVKDALYQMMATHSENTAVTLIRILKDGRGRSEPERRSGPTAPEPAGFLDGYPGTEPLIGLFRVVECRSEEGHTYCFLCHCCRIRSNKKDIIDHLTTSSHLVNYLMETHPEKVGVMMADINPNYPLLQSLAKKVEQQEGRGELKVVNAPGSLCRLLTGKSYHWCIKMLFNGWAHTDIRKRKIAVEGPSVRETSDEVMPQKSAVLVSQWPKTLPAKRKTRKGTHTVFNVRLPLTTGSMLLARNSFNTDGPAVSSTYSPSPDSDITPLPEPQWERCDLDYDAGSFDADPTQHTSRPQSDLRGGDADAGQYMGPFPPYGGGGGFHEDNAHSNQAENVAVTKHRNVNWEDNRTGRHGYRERSRQEFYDERQNRGPWTEWPYPAVPYVRVLSPWSIYCRREGRRAEQGYNSTSQSNIGTTDVIQRYCDQQRPSATHGHAGFPSGIAGQRGPSGESAAHSDAAWFGVPPWSGDPLARGGGGAPRPAVRFLETEQRLFPTYAGGHHWS
ncbi:uncharacterized protein LOC120826927 isoform X2 [Gasterosteus aculeatus]